MNSRPMSEHEGALFDAIVVIAETLLDLGTDPEKLKSRLSDARASADALSNARDSATLDFLIAGIFNPSDPPKPLDPTPKPTFRIV